MIVLCFQLKNRKKNRQVSLQYAATRKALEENVSGSNLRIKSEIDLLKSELTSDHLRKMLMRMYDEQNR